MWWVLGSGVESGTDLESRLGAALNTSEVHVKGPV